MPYRVGYIGFGGIVGGYHCNTALREDVPFTPTAAFDLREERREFAESRGLKAFDNLQDFLDSRLFDLVVVGTPNQYHCPMTCAALEAGYHVMCEKPVAMNCAELEKMIATSKKVRKMFTVHHNRRWDRDLLILKEALATEKIGNVYSIENRVHNKYGNGMMSGWRKFADHGGGMLGDWGIHVLDQILYLIKEPVHSVWGKTVTFRSGEVDDSAKILITFKSGLTSLIEATNFTPLHMPKWYVSGDNGTIIVDEVSGRVGTMRYAKEYSKQEVSVPLYPNYSVASGTYDEYQVTDWEEVALPLTPQPQDWAALYWNLANYLDGKEDLVVTPESVLRCFKVFEAAQKSNETGLTVEL